MSFRLWSVKEGKFDICGFISIAFFNRYILSPDHLHLKRIQEVFVNVLKQRFISGDSEGKVVNSQSSNDVRFEVKLCGTLGCEKTAIIKFYLVLNFAVLSVDKINVKFMFADIFAEILTNINGTSSTLIRSQSFSKVYFYSYFFQLSSRGV